MNQRPPHSRVRMLMIVFAGAIALAVAAGAAESNAVPALTEVPVAARDAFPPVPVVPALVETNAAKTPESNDVVAVKEASARDEQTLRSYLEVQAKLHSTLLAIEQARHEAGAASASNAAALTERLRQMESALAMQREIEREAAGQSNRTLLIVAGGFAGLGVLALALVVFFQNRGLTRLAEIATSLPGLRMIDAPPGLPAPSGRMALLPASVSSGGEAARLLGVIDQLERRIQELEHTTLGASPVPEAKPTDGHQPLRTHPANGDRVSSLLGKAQALASLGKAAEAVKCFDEVLTQEPAQVTALLGKAKLLEKLERPEDALACCESVLALQGAPTQAWLLKGGLLQRLGRNQEALVCYEQALRGQEVV